MLTLTTALTGWFGCRPCLVSQGAVQKDSPSRGWKEPGVDQGGRNRHKAAASRPDILHGCSCTGDTQALPGYVSFYMQLQDPNSSSSNRWDCFASYKLAVLNQAAPGRDADLSRESWHRFSSRPARQQSRPLSSSSHGWADFASAAQVRAPCAHAVVVEPLRIISSQWVCHAALGPCNPGHTRCLQAWWCELPDVRELPACALVWLPPCMQVQHTRNGQ